MLTRREQLGLEQGRPKLVYVKQSRATYSVIPLYEIKPVQPIFVFRKFTVNYVVNCARDSLVDWWVLGENEIKVHFAKL